MKVKTPKMRYGKKGLANKRRLMQKYRRTKARMIKVNDDFTATQKFAVMWRKSYGLPPIRVKPRQDVIKGLKGMMRKYADNRESVVDAIKESREREDV